jgi:hypothetical protein
MTEKETAASAPCVFYACVSAEPRCVRRAATEAADKKKKGRLPMLKHIANLALAIEVSALSAVAVFLIATVAGQPAVNFA